MRREFGPGVLQFDFWKAIPHNKQLTRSQAANLFQYLLKKQEKIWQRPRRKGPKIDPWYRSVVRIHEELRRHGYDGAGRVDRNFPEILVFNPSRVTPISAHEFTYTRADRWLVEGLNLSEPILLG